MLHEHLIFQFEVTSPSMRLTFIEPKSAPKIFFFLILNFTSAIGT